MTNTFWKRLGGLTATLPSKTREYRYASHILSSEAIVRAKARALEKDEQRRISFNEWFKNRPSARYDWFEKLQAKLPDHDLQNLEG